MKATAKAPSNIAFIKYWGKADDELRLPLNSSLSMNLSGAYTITTVDFSPDYTQDTVDLIDGTFSEKEKTRVIECLGTIRQKAFKKEHAKIVTKNTFPKGTGAAASASGFAALVVAASHAASLSLSERELTILARRGSGSACRSIPDGFVIWEKGLTTHDSYAYSIYPSDYWDICDALIIVDSQMKKVSTSDGMKTISTSPFLSERLKAIPDRLSQIKIALEHKNFPLFGKIIEEDCLDMHHVMQTQDPTLMYWNEKTRLVMTTVLEWRKIGLAVYFTIDAGPNIHLIFEKKDEELVMNEIKKIPGIETVIMNYSAEGTELISKHLF